MRSPRPAANTMAGKFFICKTHLASFISTSLALHLDV